MKKEAILIKTNNRTVAHAISYQLNEELEKGTHYLLLHESELPSDKSIIDIKYIVSKFKNGEITLKKYKIDKMS